MTFQSQHFTFFNQNGANMYSITTILFPHEVSKNKISDLIKVLLQTMTRGHVLRMPYFSILFLILTFKSYKPGVP